MKDEFPTKAQEWAAYYDNIRTNQIGGETDGISLEVAEDLGYHPPRDNELESRPATNTTLGSKAVKTTGIQEPRFKNGRKKSMTPAAEKARQRRAKKRKAEGRRIQDNADPWGADMGGY